MFDDQSPTNEFSRLKQGRRRREANVVVCMHLHMYVYQQAPSVLAVLAVRLSDYLPTGRKVSILAQVSRSISWHLYDVVDTFLSSCWFPFPQYISLPAALL